MHTDHSFLFLNSFSAQAMHWMDTSKLYPEVERVLKPGGSFVVYGYGLVALDHPDAMAALTHVI